MNRFAWLACGVAAICLPYGTAKKPLRDCGSKGAVDFQIVTDKSVYRAKSTIHVKFIVTNAGEKSLYLFRQMNDCSSKIGYYQVLILDHHGRQVPAQECFADMLMSEFDALQMLTNPKFGIALKPWQIYGAEADFEAPSEAGKYRIKAELIPPGLPDEQRQALAGKSMRVLECRVPAPIVTVTVK